LRGGGTWRLGSEFREEEGLRAGNKWNARRSDEKKGLGQENEDLGRPPKAESDQVRSVGEGDQEVSAHRKRDEKGERGEAGKGSPRVGIDHQQASKVEERISQIVGKGVW